LLLNSHSPVVLSALLDAERRPVDGTVLFADTAIISDPQRGEQRRRTRLRSVDPGPQRILLEGDSDTAQGLVSDLEVRKVLDTVLTEG
jgi:hypothetical protein